MPDAGMPTQAALALMSMLLLKTTEIILLYLTAQT
jgi:hypothetical protein